MLLDRIERRRQRAKARWLSRELPTDVRERVSGLFTRIWNETGDVAAAKAKLEAELAENEYGFDPATVLLLLRLGLLIFEMLKALGYLSVSEEQLSAVLEIDTEDPQ